jgi:hypothetical protein
MLKLLILVALCVGGFVVVRRILSDDTGMDADSYYGLPDTPPASS